MKIKVFFVALGLAAIGIVWLEWYRDFRPKPAQPTQAAIHASSNCVDRHTLKPAECGVATSTTWFGEGEGAYSTPPDSSDNQIWGSDFGQCFLCGYKPRVCHIDWYTCDHGQLYRLHLANHTEGDPQDIDCYPIPESAPRDAWAQTWFDEKIATPHTTNCPKNYAGPLTGHYPVLYVPPGKLASLRSAGAPFAVCSPPNCPPSKNLPIVDAFVWKETTFGPYLACREGGRCNVHIEHMVSQPFWQPAWVPSQISERDDFLDTCLNCYVDYEGGVR